MAKRWRDPTEFRADPHAAAGSAPSRRQAVSLVVALVLLAGAITAASYVFQPDKSRAFDLFHGSLFVNNQNAPVALDLATGQPTVRLLQVNKQVSAPDYNSVHVTPLDGGTLVLNTASGEFNMVDSTGFVLKTDSGVKLPALDGARATGIASGPDAFIIQNGPDTSRVYLVTPSTLTDAHPKPRAYLNLGRPVVDPSGAVSAGGRLWALTSGPDGSPTRLSEFAVPANSAPGVLLKRTEHGDVLGPAALATARAADGSTAIGLATNGEVRIVGAGAGRTVRLDPVPGLRRVKAVSNTAGRLTFLMQGGDGWYLTSMAADGSDRHQPRRITGIPGGARLARPAWSDGALYTADLDSGVPYEIDARGRATHPGIADYPLVENEAQSAFDDMEVITRGPRVVINSPRHLNAIVLFTDGSHPPLTVLKQDAVPVNAAGALDAVTPTGGTQNGDKKPTKNPSPASAPKQQSAVDPVSNAIICRTTTQPPHKPTVGTPNTSPQSVTVSWTYQTIGQQDCVPSTYNVDVYRSNGGDRVAHAPVNGVTSVTVDGLAPDTGYDVTVSAVINGRETRSDPVHFETTKAGSSPPVGVRAATTSTGAWTVTWASCGTLSSSCIPSSSWEVIPSVCDGIGLSGPLAPVTVVGDPTTTVQPGATYVGSAGLLGRGLSFRVQGFAQDGSPGTVSDATPCLRSWRPPTTSAMTLTASTQPSANGASVPVTAVVDLGAQPAFDAGGLGATITFQLTGNGTSVSSGAVTYAGTSSRVSATFGAVAPGVAYTVSALVSPPGHPEAASSLAPVDVSTATSWPVPTLQATCTSTGLITCDLHVSVTNVSSAGANGEQFALTSGSGIRCGNAFQQITGPASFDPSQTSVGTSLSQTNGFYGVCTISVALQEIAGSAPPYYGNVTSPTGSVDIDLGAPASAGAGQGDFTVQWSSSGSSAEVDYVGPRTSLELLALTSNWSEVLYGPDGTVCGSASAQPGNGADKGPAVTVPVSADCLTAQGAQPGWTVRVSYHNTLSGTDSGPFSYDLTGGPPGYVPPCVPSGFAASWAGPSLSDGVQVTIAPSDISHCSAWHYQLLTSDNTACNDPTATDGQAPPVTLAPTCAATPDHNWTVAISWTDENGNPQPAVQVVVAGDPPTP